MNYFERLVRRALLRPAVAPGAVLEDPFTVVAEWPLETPAAKPASDAAVPVAAERTTDSMREAALPAAPPTAPPSSLAEQALPTVLQPLPAAPTEASRPIAESVGKGVQAQPPGEESRPETAIAPQRDALALADAFMRSIGVQSQLPDLAPESAPQPEAAKPSAAIMPEEKPASAPRSPEVVPLPPPRPAPAMRSAPRSAAKAAAPSPQPRRETRAEAAPRTRTVVETRHVVVERKASPRGEDGGVSGGGAPRFGLGQL